MHYVYLLRSISCPDEKYIGVTTDVKKRLVQHNSKKSPHTAKFTPWELISCVAFKSKNKAEDFEKYLKSGSGRAFAKKRFW